MQKGIGFWWVEERVRGGGEVISRIGIANRNRKEPKQKVQIV